MRLLWNALDQAIGDNKINKFKPLMCKINYYYYFFLLRELIYF